MIGGAAADQIDAGAGDDLILGDNASADRRSRFGDFTNARFESLNGQAIFDSSGSLLVDGQPRNRPGVPTVWGDLEVKLLNHDLSTQNTANTNRFGNDQIAGGAGDDMIFGELGNDVIQGDGSINITPSVVIQPDGSLNITPSVPDSAGAGTDGDDYIEGGGGNDLIFGDLGRDDIVGGSSNWFGLTSTSPATPDDRPDASDTIFGGAGTDLGRNSLGDQSTDGHGRDSDTILGDSGDIIRLVSVAPDGTTTSYRRFTYEQMGTGYGANPRTQLVPTGYKLLDYTISAGPNDRGAADLIEGEAGDDTILGQVGDDVLFGNGQDDNIYGGAGNDRIYGGSGDDGIMGDDGVLLTIGTGTPRL